MPEKFYGRYFNLRLREEKISMPEMQRQKTQAGNNGFPDSNFEKKLAGTSDFTLVT